MQVIFIIGRLCSGKNYAANQMRIQAANTSDVLEIVDIGDIVRAITSTETRIFSKDLDATIIKHLRMQLVYSTCDRMIITGMRQLSIYQEISLFCIERGYEVEVTFLDVDTETRKVRYELRDAQKDSQISFEEADRKDSELGLDELIDYIKLIIK